MDTHQGLTNVRAEELLREHGPNELPEPAPVTLWRRFFRQLKSPMIAVLIFAAVFDVIVWFVDAFEGWPVEGAVIAAVLLLNAGLGTFQEYRSEQAIARLRGLTAPLAWVFREGVLVHVPSRSIVPGDIVRVDAGDRVPADGVLGAGGGVMIDESVLTGESVPVEKVADGELFSGTLIVRGKGLFRVTSTGGHSAMGRIAAMLANVTVEKTPLERRMDALGAQIVRWISALGVLLIVAGTATEGLRRLDEVVMFAVALAVAAIPEGMPAVVTLTLALGVQRMAKRSALVRRMTAVESLGSVTVIATDKTGTLTLNQMTVRATELADRAEALRAMTLANDANLGSGVGDPLELALLEHAREQGIDIAAVQRAYPRLEERPFDSAWKFMRVTVESGPMTKSYLKGAPEIVLARCALAPDEQEAWQARCDHAASEGYRVLALAAAEGQREDALALLGLVMLWDPPRPEVKSALAKARQAGVRVVMITGDHAATAHAMASAIGLPRDAVLTGAAIDAMSPEELRVAVREVDVFARVSPTHKLRLVEAYRAEGHIIAMTGDGVNDAPALKRADVGIAMGKRGSDVAREVSDLVLLDDNFATIVAAIEEGRGIYENIQSFIRFTFSTNVALMVLVVTGAVAAYVEGLRDATGMLLVPLTAVQLLWINFLGDGPPALALAVDRTPGHMDRPPRPPSSGLLDRSSTLFIFATGAIKGGIGIALLIVMPKLGYGVIAIQTVLFLYESIGKLVSVYPSRRRVRGRPANIALHVAVIGGTGLQLLTIAVPALRRLLGLDALDARALLIVAGMVLATWISATVVSAIVRSGPTDSVSRTTRASVLIDHWRGGTRA
jgi:Ca2+-transporting ATPase